jgi:transposase
VRAVFTAATDPAQAGLGMPEQRAGALERVRFALEDLAHARAELAVVEARMVAILDTLGLTELVTSIRGLSAVGAAAILAETGDPTASPAPARWSNTPGSAPCCARPTATAHRGPASTCSHRSGS